MLLQRHFITLIITPRRTRVKASEQSGHTNYFLKLWEANTYKVTQTSF